MGTLTNNSTLRWIQITAPPLKTVLQGAGKYQNTGSSSQKPGWLTGEG